MLNEDSNWTVNPDAKDTVQTGAWDFGDPECSLILGVVTQPERDHTLGEGKMSFHTGPEKGANFSADDVDGGKTTVDSPLFAIGSARYPMLVYYAWHVAVDLSSIEGPQNISADLVVQASNDGGTSWVEIDRVSENTEDWLRRTIALAPHLEPSARTRFRFAIEDTTPAGTVEAGIDDLEIVDLLTHCSVPQHQVPGIDGSKNDTTELEETGFSCAAVSSEPSGSIPSLVILLTMLGLLIRRRR